MNITFALILHFAHVYHGPTLKCQTQISMIFTKSKTATKVPFPLPNSQNCYEMSKTATKGIKTATKGLILLRRSKKSESTRYKCLTSMHYEPMLIHTLRVHDELSFPHFR